MRSIDITLESYYGQSFQGTFSYTDDDFLFQVEPNCRTTLDELLRREWDLKMNKGNVFWYKLNITLQRTISDRFLLQVSIRVIALDNKIRTYLIMF